jgi:hypothetical protein
MTQFHFKYEEDLLRHGFKFRFGEFTKFYVKEYEGYNLKFSYDNFWKKTWITMVKGLDIHVYAQRQSTYEIFESRDTEKIDKYLEDTFAELKKEMDEKTR